MILCDVNVLIYAYREDSKEHSKYRDWLTAIVNGNQAYGVLDLVLSGFLRIVTNPRVYATPSPLEPAIEFVEQVRFSPSGVVIQPGARHWEIFLDLSKRVSAKGNLIPDVFFAAIAIENGCTWVTTDGDYYRFPGLQVKHPFDFLN